MAHRRSPDAHALLAAGGAQQIGIGFAAPVPVKPGLGKGLVEGAAMRLLGFGKASLGEEEEEEAGRGKIIQPPR